MTPAYTYRPDVYTGTNPDISVIMATYNRAGYLERSIGSYLRQTFTRAELLIVDDGSNDDTFRIVKDFQNTRPDIRYIRHTNRKLPLSRNAGITASAGNYLTFLDSDDEYKPDHLESRFRFMQAHPEIDLIEGGVIVIGDPYIADKNNLQKKIHLSECIIGASFFGKREVFISSGGFDKQITYSEDSAFWEKVRTEFQVKKFTHESYIYHHETPGSISNSI